MDGVDRGYRGVLRGAEKTQAIEGSGTSKLTPRLLSEDPTTWSSEILLAVRLTAPVERGVRHKLVFELARALKAIPELKHVKAEELRPVVKHWREISKQHIGTKYIEETWFDSYNAWDRVRFARGEEPMANAWHWALAAPPPCAANAFENPKIRRLVALCYQLQLLAGEKPFFLSCREAAKWLEVDFQLANRWLNLLVRELGSV